MPPHPTPRAARLAALTLAFALAFTCAQATTAYAQAPSDAEQAEAFYLQALQLYNAGRYREALDSFDRAIELQPDPIFFCNRGAVLLKLKEHRDALAALQRCRRDLTPDDPEELHSIDAEVHALALNVEVVSPSARAIARRHADADALAANPPNLDNDPVLHTLAWGTGGFAVLALGGALAVDLLTLSVIDEYEDAAAAGDDPKRYNDLQSVIQQRRVLIGSLLSVGLLSAATSGLLFWLTHEEPGDHTAPAASVEPLPGGAAVHLALPF